MEPLDKGTLERLKALAEAKYREAVENLLDNAAITPSQARGQFETIEVLDSMIANYRWKIDLYDLDDSMVPVDKQLYTSMAEQVFELNALKAAGVENWEGYEKALKSDPFVGD